MKVKINFSEKHCVLSKIQNNKNRKRINCFDKLPEEIFQLVLSHLPFEEITELRLVNHKFKSSCNCLLRKGYRHVKHQVKMCSERTGKRLLRYKLEINPPIKRHDYITKIFWFVVNEFLTKSFRPYDTLVGYLDWEYSVNGKTLDVVRRILWFKDMKDPLQYLVEMMIGRGDRNSNMKYFECFSHAYSAWFRAKKYCGQLVTPIFVPVYDRTQPGLELPLFHAYLKHFVFSLTLDMLTTMWAEKESTEKHRVLSLNQNCGNHLLVKVLHIATPSCFVHSHLCVNLDPTFYEYEDYNEFSDED